MSVAGSNLSGVKNGRTKRDSSFPAGVGETFSWSDHVGKRTDHELQATLVKWMRDPRSGEVHLPNEEVTVMGLGRFMRRTSLIVRHMKAGAFAYLSRLARTTGSMDALEDLTPVLIERQLVIVEVTPADVPVELCGLRKVQTRGLS